MTYNKAKKHPSGVINSNVSFLLKTTREIRKRALSAFIALIKGKTKEATLINSILKEDVQTLSDAWPSRIKSQNLEDLERHIHFGELSDYNDILGLDIPHIEDKLIEYSRTKNKQKSDVSLEDLLHLRIKEASYYQFQDGHYREAVFNAVVSVFDYIRERSGLDLDGEGLVTTVLSPNNPILVISTLKTESGKNEQLGFMQILQGTYKAVRNPKAHSIKIKTTSFEAAQYMIFASLLMRKIEDAKKIKQEQ